MFWLTSCLSKMMQITTKLMTKFYLMSATLQWQNMYGQFQTSVEKPTGIDFAVIAPPPLSNATPNAAVYMAGYLQLKVTVSDCDVCSEQLILPRLPPPFQEMSFYTFRHEKKNIKRRFFGPSNIVNGQLCWMSQNYVLCNFWRHDTHVICVN